MSHLSQLALPRNTPPGKARPRRSYSSATAAGVDVGVEDRQREYDYPKIMNPLHPENKELPELDSGSDGGEETYSAYTSQAQSSLKSRYDRLHESLRPNARVRPISAKPASAASTSVNRAPMRTSMFSASPPVFQDEQDRDELRNELRRIGENASSSERLFQLRREMRQKLYEDSHPYGQAHGGSYAEITQHNNSKTTDSKQLDWGLLFTHGLEAAAAALEPEGSLASGYLKPPPELTPQELFQIEQQKRQQQQQQHQLLRPRPHTAGPTRATTRATSSSGPTAREESEASDAKAQRRPVSAMPRSRSRPISAKPIAKSDDAADQPKSPRSQPQPHEIQHNAPKRRPATATIVRPTVQGVVTSAPQPAATALPIPIRPSSAVSSVRSSGQSRASNSSGVLRVASQRQNLWSMQDENEAIGRTLFYFKSLDLHHQASITTTEMASHDLAQTQTGGITASTQISASENAKLERFVSLYMSGLAKAAMTAKIMTGVDSSLSRSGESIIHFASEESMKTSSQTNQRPSASKRLPDPPRLASDRVLTVAGLGLTRSALRFLFAYLDFDAERYLWWAQLHNLSSALEKATAENRTNIQVLLQAAMRILPQVKFSHYLARYDMHSSESLRIISQSTVLSQLSLAAGIGEVKQDDTVWIAPSPYFHPVTRLVLDENVLEATSVRALARLLRPKLSLMSVGNILAEANQMLKQGITQDLAQSFQPSSSSSAKPLIASMAPRGPRSLQSLDPDQSWKQMSSSSLSMNSSYYQGSSSQMTSSFQLQQDHLLTLALRSPLRALSLRGTSLSQHDAAELFDALTPISPTAPCASIEDLDVSSSRHEGRTFLGAVGATALSRTIKRNNVLKTLTLRACGLIPEALPPFLGGCKLASGSLRVLDLSGNGITARAAPALAEALLTGLMNLRTLILDDNDLGELGLCDLLPALRQMSFLSKLSIRRNGLTQRSFTLLSDAMGDMLSLEQLYLDGNPFVDEVSIQQQQHQLSHDTTNAVHSAHEAASRSAAIAKQRAVAISRGIAALKLQKMHSQKESVISATFGGLAGSQTGKDPQVALPPRLDRVAATLRKLDLESKIVSPRIGLNSNLVVLSLSRCMISARFVAELVAALTPPSSNVLALNSIPAVSASALALQLEDHSKPSGGSTGKKPHPKSPPSPPSPTSSLRRQRSPDPSDSSSIPIEVVQEEMDELQNLPPAAAALLDSAPLLLRKSVNSSDFVALMASVNPPILPYTILNALRAQAILRLAMHHALAAAVAAGLTPNPQFAQQGSGSRKIDPSAVLNLNSTALTLLAAAAADTASLNIGLASLGVTHGELAASAALMPLFSPSHPALVSPESPSSGAKFDSFATRLTQFIEGTGPFRDQDPYYRGLGSQLTAVNGLLKAYFDARSRPIRDREFVPPPVSEAVLAKFDPTLGLPSVTVAQQESGIRGWGLSAISSGVSRPSLAHALRGNPNLIKSYLDGLPVSELGAAAMNPESFAEFAEWYQTGAPSLSTESLSCDITSAEGNHESDRPPLWKPSQAAYTSHYTASTASNTPQRNTQTRLAMGASFNPSSRSLAWDRLYVTSGTPHQCPLNVLNLSFNRIGDEGAEALARWIRHPRVALTELYVDGNEISEVGGSALARAVRGAPIDTKLFSTYARGMLEYMQAVDVVGKYYQVGRIHRRSFNGSISPAVSSFERRGGWDYDGTASEAAGEAGDDFMSSTASAEIRLATSRRPVPAPHVPNWLTIYQPRSTTLLSNALERARGSLSAGAAPSGLDASRIRQSKSVSTKPEDLAWKNRYPWQWLEPRRPAIFPGYPSLLPIHGSTHGAIPGSGTGIGMARGGYLGFLDAAGAETKNQILSHRTGGLDFMSSGGQSVGILNSLASGIPFHPPDNLADLYGPPSPLLVLSIESNKLGQAAGDEFCLSVQKCPGLLLRFGANPLPYSTFRRLSIVSALATQPTVPRERETGVVSHSAAAPGSAAVSDSSTLHMLSLLEKSEVPIAPTSPHAEARLEYMRCYHNWLVRRHQYLLAVETQCELYKEETRRLEAIAKAAEEGLDPWMRDQVQNDNEKIEVQRLGRQAKERLETLRRDLKDMIEKKEAEIRRKEQEIAHVIMSKEPDQRKLKMLETCAGIQVFYEHEGKLIPAPTQAASTKKGEQQSANESDPLEGENSVAGSSEAKAEDNTEKPDAPDIVGKRVFRAESASHAQTALRIVGLYSAQRMQAEAEQQQQQQSMELLMAKQELYNEHVERLKLHDELSTFISELLAESLFAGAIDVEAAVATFADVRDTYSKVQRWANAELREPAPLLDLPSTKDEGAAAPTEVKVETDSRKGKPFKLVPVDEYAPFLRLENKLVQARQRLESAVEEAPPNPPPPTRNSAARPATAARIRPNPRQAVPITTNPSLRSVRPLTANVNSTTRSQLQQQQPVRRASITAPAPSGINSESHMPRPARPVSAHPRSRASISGADGRPPQTAQSLAAFVRDDFSRWGSEGDNDF